MNKFPSWRYHATEDPRIVQDAEESAALGAGWHQSPADCFADVTAEPAPEPQSVQPATVDERPTRRKR